MSKEKLNDEHVDIVRNRRKEGASIKEIAEELGVVHTTLRRFMRKHRIPTEATSKVMCRLDAYAAFIVEAYNDGATITSLKRDYQCDSATIKKLLRKHGVELRTTWSRNSKSQGIRAYPQEELLKICEQYKAGETLEALAARYKVSVHSIKKALEEHHVELRSVGPVRKSDREKRNTLFKRLYGITVERYEEMIKDQNGTCAICEVPPEHGRNHGKKTLCIDHDHESGNVRGLLCHTCNMGISYFEDNPQYLSMASEYVR